MQKNPCIVTLNPALVDDVETLAELIFNLFCDYCQQSFSHCLHIFHRRFCNGCEESTLNQVKFYKKNFWSCYWVMQNQSNFLKCHIAKVLHFSFSSQQKIITTDSPKPINCILMNKNF